MRWGFRKKRQSTMGEADAIEWLERGYDADLDRRIRMHNGQHPSPSTLALEYRERFSLTHNSGIASIKLDHETMLTVQGRVYCRACNDGSELIVIG